MPAWGVAGWVAVLAAGLDQPYPAGHRPLFDRIAEQGVLISELAPGEHPTRVRFLARNRLIAALSPGTVIVEAAARSGARNTVTWANELGRLVMAVPGPVGSATSVTPHRLIREAEAARDSALAAVEHADHHRDQHADKAEDRAKGRQGEQQPDRMQAHRFADQFRGQDIAFDQLPDGEYQRDPEQVAGVAVLDQAGDHGGDDADRLAEHVEDLPTERPASLLELLQERLVDLLAMARRRRAVPRDYDGVVAALSAAGRSSAPSTALFTR